MEGDYISLDTANAKVRALEAELATAQTTIDLLSVDLQGASEAILLLRQQVTELKEEIRRRDEEQTASEDDDDDDDGSEEVTEESEQAMQS